MPSFIWNYDLFPRCNQALRGANPGIKKLPGFKAGSLQVLTVIFT
ncbi:hypothetical protein X792_00785 [Dehalococcoides mccartyi CG1]|nr:hypothetical protein X792_00785 [Dehalococcoides mccartyi CG1]